VAIVLAAGCTYPKLLFWHKNLENIQQKKYLEKKKISHAQPGFEPSNHSSKVHHSAT